MKNETKIKSKKDRRKLSSRTSATTLYQQDALEVKNICHLEGATEAAVLRHIVSDWLRIRRMKSYGSDQLTAPLRAVYEQVVSEQIQPLGIQLKSILAGVKGLESAINTSQTAQGTPTSRQNDDELKQKMLRLLEQLDQGSKSPAALETERNKRLNLIANSQVLAQDMLFEMIVRSVATQRLLIKYLVRAGLVHRGMALEQINESLEDDFERWTKKGYEVVEEIEEALRMGTDYRAQRSKTPFA